MQSYFAITWLPTSRIRYLLLSLFYFFLIIFYTFCVTKPFLLDLTPYISFEQQTFCLFACLQCHLPQQSSSRKHLVICHLTTSTLNCQYQNISTLLFWGHKSTSSCWVWKCPFCGQGLLKPDNPPNTFFPPVENPKIIVQTRISKSSLSKAHLRSELYWITWVNSFQGVTFTIWCFSEAWYTC